MAENISNQQQEVLYKYYKQEVTGLYSLEPSYFDINFLLHKHILQEQSSQFFKIIFINVCNFSIFVVFAKLETIQLILI